MVAADKLDTNEEVVGAPHGYDVAIRPHQGQKTVPFLAACMIAVCVDHW